MKRYLLLLCAFVAASAGAESKLTLLQTVDVGETMPSTEGGVAELYLVSGDQAERGRCRIEATHYGEMGRLEYVFEFGSVLENAESRGYQYNLPIYRDDGAQVVSVEIASMADGDQIAQFRDLFVEYRAVFKTEELRKCGER